MDRVRDRVRLRGLAIADPNRPASKQLHVINVVSGLSAGRGRGGGGAE